MKWMVQKRFYSLEITNAAANAHARTLNMILF